MEFGLFRVTQLLAMAKWTHPNNGSINERLEANETRVPVVGCSAVNGAAQTAGCTQDTTTTHPPYTGKVYDNHSKSIR